MLLFNKGNNKRVYLGLGLDGAGKRGVAAEILVRDRFKRNHVKAFAHSVAHYHCTRKLCCLLNIV